MNIDMNWDDTPYITLDTEGTGFSRNDRICEIALCVAYRGEVMKRYSCRVNPGVPISESCTAVHGISDSDVASCPSLLEIKDQVLSYLCMDVPIVAHNLVYDARMLCYDLGEYWPSGIPTLCTLHYAKYKHPTISGRRRGYALKDLAALLSVSYDDTKLHGALYDAELLARVTYLLVRGRSIVCSMTKYSEEWVK